VPNPDKLEKYFNGSPQLGETNIVFQNLATQFSPPLRGIKNTKITEITDRILTH